LSVLAFLRHWLLVQFVSFSAERKPYIAERKQTLRYVSLFGIANGYPSTHKLPSVYGLRMSIAMCERVRMEKQINRLKTDFYLDYA